MQVGDLSRYLQTRLTDLEYRVFMDFVVPDCQGEKFVLLSVAACCRKYGVSRRWLYTKLLPKLEDEANAWEVLMGGSENISE